MIEWKNVNEELPDMYASLLKFILVKLEDCNVPIVTFYGENSDGLEFHIPKEKEKGFSYYDFKDKKKITHWAYINEPEENK